MMEGNPLSTIKDLTFGENVTSIGDGAFAQCTLLKDLTIPRNIESVGQHAFDYCTGLHNVTIEKITAVKQLSEDDYEYSRPGWDIQIFFGCKTFSVLHFCEDVKIIPSDLCEGVQTIYSDSKTPPLFSLGYFDVPKTATVYVPADALSAYKQADGWKDFWNIVGTEGTGETEEPSGNDGTDETEEPSGNDGTGETEEPSGNDGTGETEEPSGNDGTGETDEPNGNDGTGETEEPSGSDVTNIQGAEAAAPTFSLQGHTLYLSGAATVIRTDGTLVYVGNGPVALTPGCYFIRVAGETRKVMIP
jgi:hypothetical protein